MPNFEQPTHEVPRHLKRAEIRLIAVYDYHDPDNPGVLDIQFKTVNKLGEYSVSLLDGNLTETTIAKPMGDLANQLTPARKQEALDLLDGILADWEARLAQ
jgi:hypothetical protein